MIVEKKGTDKTWKKYILAGQKKLRRKEKTKKKNSWRPCSQRVHKLNENEKCGQ